MSTLLFRSVSQLVTCRTADESSVESGALAVRDGRIEALGPEADLVARFPDAETVDCEGGVITPGFVDSHTHAVFGAWRAGEYVLRSRGVPYMEIARRGGGILSSVRDVRARTEDELVELARPRLREMVRLGTTTAEVKSGYGLETAAELRMLRAMARLAAEGPVELERTFLGAHEVPPEYRDRPDAFVDLVIEEMLPEAAAGDLARFCDVFMEPGVFTGFQARRILEAAADRGLVPKLHADEFEGSGGAELAVELDAASADHLGAISDAGIRALAGSNTVATLLPATLFFLGKRDHAPARRLVEEGATVALATDFNPGSAPSASMPLVLTLACSQMGLDPLQAIHAATAGGARALRLDDGRGELREGAPADLIVWSVREYAEIPYRFGRPPIAGVWKRGDRVA
ncbi:MAG: imidazolonepropionase [Gemmatimonadota bacterium]|jgi:imidazolonepropionase